MPRKRQSEEKIVHAIRQGLEHIGHSCPGVEAVSDFLKHWFCWEGRILYRQGDTQFINHSSRPNMASPDGSSWFATRLILEGEELLDDYGTCEKNPEYECLCQKYGAESSGAVSEFYKD